MSTKLDKKELKGPDAFVSTSDHAFAWIERHMRSVSLALGVVFIAAVAWVSYGFIQARAETQAADALYAPQAELKKAESKIREERAGAMQKMAGLSKKEKSEAKPESARPVDFEKDFRPAVEKIMGAIQAHSGSKAAMVASLNLSYFLIQQKQFTEALKVMDLPTYRASRSDILSAFWQMHRGLTFMENQKYAEAGQAYQAVIDNPELKAFHPEALLKLGVALEQKGEADKARQIYEKLGREFPDSDASASGQQYLRLLELKSQKG